MGISHAQGPLSRTLTKYLQFGTTNPSSQHQDLWNGPFYWHKLPSCRCRMVWTERDCHVCHVRTKEERRKGQRPWFCPVRKCSYLKPTAKWMFQNFYSILLHWWVVVVSLGQLASWRQTPYRHPVISANEPSIKLPGTQTRHIGHLHTITRSCYKGRGTTMITSP